MADKLIEGSINIEDKASEALSKIEQALRNIEKIAKPVTEQMKGLNKEISKFKTAPIENGKLHKDIESNLKGVTGFSDLSKAGQFRVVEDVAKRASRHAAATDKAMTASILGEVAIKVSNAKTAGRIGVIQKQMERDQLQYINRSALITQTGSDRSERQKASFGFKRQLEELRYRHQIGVIAEKEASQNRILEKQKEIKEQQKQVKLSEKLAQQEAKLAEAEANRTDWQKRMAALAAKGGKLQPLWESFGKATSPLNLARQPHLVSEGLGGVFGKLGSFGKGVGAFATGRMVGGLLGSANIGGIIGGAVAGPVGIAVAAAGTLVLAGVNKVVEGVQEVCQILNDISSERATESTSLRRKMQMSSEMFGVDPRDVAAIDKKIFGLRAMEQNYYKKGISGREVVNSAIDWLHLLGTKESGGVFKNEKQAFDFAEAISSIVKMNGLSEREAETVRYQGMQILSKGYADILDIKPLLNSAPGFVRDLLQQTGMSRKELLASGRTHGFTADKFLDALMNVKDYYAILSERSSSRTAEQQEEAAKNIIGAAAVWDEMYKKHKAESNQEVANAIVQAGIAEDIKQSWYQMFSATNDAADGTLAKANLEKTITNQIMKQIMGAYVTFVLMKNAVDAAVDGIMWIAGTIGATMINIFDFIGQGLLGLFGMLFQAIGDIDPSGKLSALGEKLNPNSASRKEGRLADDLSENMANKIYEDYNAHGAEYVKNKYSYLFGMEGVTKKVTGIREVEAPNAVAGIVGGLLAGPIGSALGRSAFSEKKKILESYGYSAAGNFGEQLLFANSGDAAVERFRDKDQMKTFIKENIGNFIEDGKLKPVVDAWATQSGEMDASRLQRDFGLRHSNVDDYSWENSMLDRWKGVNDFVKRELEEDLFKDPKRAMDMANKTLAETNKAMQDVKSPYVEKIAKDTSDIKNGKGKGDTKILDVLKEIAGITVINKVTTVRPDVVFNFGSYGRSGKNEDPNLRAVGDKLNSFYNQQEFKSDINGVPVLNDAG